MDENEVAERFAEITKTEKLVNHPAYIQLMMELDKAAIRLFNFMEEAGYGDVRTVKSSVYCPKGHLHEVFQYTCLMIPEEDSDGS